MSTPVSDSGASYRLCGTHFVNQMKNVVDLENPKFVGADGGKIHLANFDNGNNILLEEAFVLEDLNTFLVSVEVLLATGIQILTKQAYLEISKIKKVLSQALKNENNLFLIKDVDLKETNTEKSIYCLPEKKNNELYSLHLKYGHQGKRY
eukprot:snap_masked-scaffold_77-processed-gene-0.16-mRNA-1 protein AED:1.00 eAED:1.00 QI:0/0/0/0/1/1/2/0/149